MELYRGLLVMRARSLGHVGCLERLVKLFLLILIFILLMHLHRFPHPSSRAHQGILQKKSPLAMKMRRAVRVHEEDKEQEKEVHLRFYLA
jgi:hypothetical protein